MSMTPFVMAISIIFLALFLGLNLATALSKWLGIALILIFIGGIIVVFLYTASLSPNLKLRLQLHPIIGLALCLPCLATFASATPSLPIFFFNNRQSYALLFLVFFLLLTLFLVAKAVETVKGALRQKIF